MDKGQPVNGRIIGADDLSLSIATDYPWDNGVPEQIARENVRRIVHLRHRLLPDPHTMLAGGAAVGALAGATVSAIRAPSCRGCKSFDVLIGGAAGAGLGFFVACFVEAGLGTAAIFRPDKIVYEDNQ